MSLNICDIVPQELAARGQKAVLFDFDGTIAESYAVWHQVDQTFLSRRGIAWEPSLSAELASRGFKDGSAWLVEHYGLSETPEAVCDEWNQIGAELYQEQVALRPGAAAYIKAVKAAGLKTALVTNNDKDVLLALDGRIGVLGLFDVCVFGAEVGANKHQPDIYLEAARRLGVEPARCTVFEDIAYGLKSAASAGMKTVGVCSEDPVQDQAALGAYADVVINSFEGLA